MFLFDEALQRMSSRMNAPDPLHIPSHDVVTHKGVHSTIQISNSVPMWLFTHHGLTEATWISGQVFINRYSFVDSRDSCDPGESLDQLFSSYHLRCDFKLSARGFRAVVKSISRPPADVMEADYRNVAISSGKCPDNNTILALCERSQKWLKTYNKSLEIERQMSVKNLHPKDFPNMAQWR